MQRLVTRHSPFSTVLWTLATGICAFLLLVGAATLAGTAAAATGVVTAIRQVAEGDASRIEIDVEGGSRPRLVLLRKPYRVAIDLNDAVSAAKLPKADGSLVTGLRQGLAGANRYRLVVSLADAAVLRWEARMDGPRATYTLSLRPGRDADFVHADDAVALAQEALPAQPSPRVLTVVIDPGHGGVDRGATGEGGTEEKSVNLAFALALREALRAHPEIEVILTREDDTFIPLNEPKPPLPFRAR